MHQEIVIVLFVSASVLLFGSFSKILRQSMLTPPMLFCLLGVGMSFFIDPGLADKSWVMFGVLGKMTLVIILFTDAARIQLGLLMREHSIALRLLLLGLPLTVGMGFLGGAGILEGVGFWKIALLAAILAPTDAALGQSVVSSKRVPLRIRQSLNVESGLNDGLALPLVLILLSISCSFEPNASVQYWVRFALLQLSIGPVVGVVVGLLGGKIISVASRAQWMVEKFQDFSVVGLSLLAFSLAEVLGGNGFISAFCAGLTLGNSSRHLCTCLFDFSEEEGQLLSLLVFLFFGAILLPRAMEHFQWHFVLYGALSLTLFRMLPVVISLAFARLQFETTMFLGWFGPRGIASILFAILLFDHGSFPEIEILYSVTMITVAMSIFAHGMTSVPWAKAYGRRMSAMDSMEEEQKMVTQLPERISFNK